jgi:RNA polymerase sigma-70 factor (ECF subfamily)
MQPRLATEAVESFRAARAPANPAAALKAVLLDNRPMLIRFLAARRVDRDDAEDLLQDLFLKLESRPVGPVLQSRAYLYRVLNNQLTDHRRSAARRARREADWVSAQSGASPDLDDRPSPDRALIARERLQAVSSALAALPERTLTIFRKYRLDGVGQRQIAAELGISGSAVEKHLRKAYRLVVDVHAAQQAYCPADFDAGSPIAQM